MSSPTRLLAFGMAIFHLVSTTNAFQTNCTLPTERTSYVSSPNTRGTTDILWTCLATIFACTYTVLHLNVPEQRLGRSPGWKGDLERTLKNFFSSLKWAVITIIAPEITLRMAFVQLQDARHQLRLARQKLLASQQSWTLSHMFYANMGGFALLHHDESEGEKIWHLNGLSLIALCEADIIDPASIVSAEEIDDKSKSDITGKALAILQIGYFLLSVIEREATGLTISQLELGVCGFVGCSVAIYIMWFHKPKGVQTVTILRKYEHDLPDEILEILKDIPKPWIWWSEVKSPGRRISNDTSWLKDDVATNTILALVSAVLGAVHLAGWHLDFPSKVDEGIWRGASIVSTVAVPLGVILGLPYALAAETNYLDWIVLPILMASLVLYCVSRAALMVEMFRCLFYLPPDAFEATSWAISIPHIG